MKKIRFILKRINCLVCDLALSYTLFYLLLFIRPVGFPLIAYYFASVILYFAVTYGIFHRSLMQKLLGIIIEKHPLAHTLFKILFLGIIPFCLSFFLYEYYLFWGLFWYLCVMSLVTIMSLPFTKKSLWQWCSGSQVELQKDFDKNRMCIVVLTLVISLSLIFIPLFRQSHHSDEMINNKNIASPTSTPEKAYFVKNINQYKQEPVDYIMQLFDKYDMVILCERMHPEYTQWNFFSKIILNDAFVEKIKNVFTEVGDAQNQEILDTYMNTHFAEEEDLQRATASIARADAVWPLWNNTNIYDFILHLHQFNETKDSINRINLLFSDTSYWDEIKNQSEYDSIFTRINRDSIMASKIINLYNSRHLNKCLVITNTRHAWNYGGNEAAYLSKKFGSKMTVVWINGTTQFMMPAMNGTLDEAALEITDSIWAIDFQKCPLGNMPFDLMPLKRDKCTYKDLFVGMIYCKHPSNWKIGENYPYILDNYKDTLLKKSELVGEDYLKMITNNISSGYYNTIVKRECPLIKIYNLGFLSLYCIILLYLSINLLVLCFKKQKKTAPAQ
ncbi:MAG: hypothetical protein LBO74_04265 [Candidatus Symbiothrix sp.]|jgi:hypothetical protein|nr:hypothetical protein [Candidatus Symbiothrix sp.]